ncbi:FAD-dependent oxidoreductase [Streptomyces tendae]|uniref:FAD-dependent oxidoreductase n=1 Tax=Streptomyces tendae TaxID=1932 RepID=UPI0033BC125C
MRLGVGATGTEVRHDGRTVLLDDGGELPTDVVVVGVGALPRTELAEAAGLDLAAGAVTTDAALRTRTGWPVLMTPSNKTFVGEILDVELEDRLAGTLAATIAARDGAARLPGPPGPAHLARRRDGRGHQRQPSSRPYECLDRLTHLTWPAEHAQPIEDELERLYTYPDRGRWLAVNFVASADEAVEVGGLARPLSTPPDRKVLRLDSDLADVLLIGTGFVTGGYPSVD